MAASAGLERGVWATVGYERLLLHDLSCMPRRVRSEQQQTEVRTAGDFWFSAGAFQCRHWLHYIISLAPTTGRVVRLVLNRCKHNLVLNRCKQNSVLNGCKRNWVLNRSKQNLLPGANRIGYWTGANKSENRCKQNLVLNRYKQNWVLRTGANRIYYQVQTELSTEQVQTKLSTQQMQTEFST